MLISCISVCIQLVYSFTNCCRVSIQHVGVQRWHKNLNQGWHFEVYIDTRLRRIIRAFTWRLRLKSVYVYVTLFVYQFFCIILVFPPFKCGYSTALPTRKNSSRGTCSSCSAEDVSNVQNKENTSTSASEGSIITGCGKAASIVLPRTQVIVRPAVVYLVFSVHISWYMLTSSQHWKDTYLMIYM